MYSVAQVEEISGISAFTIRYYDKCGFFPDLQRDNNGCRTFNHNDIKQLQLVDALRKSGLSIEGIQYYVKLSKTKGANVDQCLEILKDRLKVLEIKQKELSVSSQCLQDTVENLQCSLSV